MSSVNRAIINKKDVEEEEEDEFNLLIEGKERRRQLYSLFLCISLHFLSSIFFLL